MCDYKLVPVEMIKRAAVALERFAYDTFDGRNSAHELRELLTEAPAINIVATKNEQGQIVSVSLQNEDHRILEVIAEADVQGEVGEGVPDYINDAIDNLALDNYELSYTGYLQRKADAELIRAYIARTGQPTEPDEERLAMEAVMESVDPATWPGLTTTQRCALGRFAKPQPAEQQDRQSVEIMVNAAHDVYTLPLQPSGLLSGPRFVVHVPGT